MSTLYLGKRLGVAAGTARAPAAKKRAANGRAAAGVGASRR